MAYEAKVIADSISEAGDRLTTLEVTFPRIVLDQMTKHRMLSYNTSSTRAIPVEKMIRRVEEDPFIPIHWGQNQKGMVSDREMAPAEIQESKYSWLLARDLAVGQAKALVAYGAHKQIANHVLNPYAWSTCIVSGTEWSNFFALRTDPAAQPEIRKIAEMMKEVYLASDPNLLMAGEWHLPYLEEDWKDRYSLDVAKMASTARCARVSYLNQDKEINVQSDITLYERLVSGGHLSPLEHVATPVGQEMKLVGPGWNEYFSPMIGNFKGWKQLRKFIPNEDDFGKVSK